MTPSDDLSPVTVEHVELVRVRLPLARPFRTSFGTQTERDALLVHVVATESDGWGECAAPTAPVYSDEFVEGAALVLRDHLIPASLVDRRVTADRAERAIAHLHGHRMARTALLAAVVDAQLVASETSLAAHLGATRDRVPAGVSVGIPEGGTRQLVEHVAGYLEDGYVRIKAKIEPGVDVEPMRALRDTFGPGLSLQVDANGAYDADEPDHLAVLQQLDQLGLMMIEQPYGPDRIRDHARLAATLDTPVCLDESIVDTVGARDAIEAGACGIVNVKVGRVGGLREAVAIRDVCASLGVPVWCGGMLETGVGRAVNVALAALDGFDLPGDVSASDRYFAQDLTEPFELVDGYVTVPRVPGIGRRPLDDMLAGADRQTVVLP
ncbi:MAG: o-succinylbenzoate synthase [Nitriliruptoraceae bacterium]